MHSVDLGWVSMHVYNFFVSGPKFTIFFAERGRGCSWLLAFSISDISIHFGDIRDQSLTLSEFVPNFGSFLSSKKISGMRAPQKLYLDCHACLVARHREKFREVTPPSPKVIGMHTLNFVVNFWIFVVNNFCSGDPFFGGMWVSKPWPFSSMCNNMRRPHPRGQNMVFRKSLFGWVQTHMPNFVANEPKFTRLFCRTPEVLPSITCLSNFRYLDPFWKYSRSKSKVVWNRPKFCTF